MTAAVNPSASSTAGDASRHQGLRWVLIAVFAALLGIMLAAGIVALQALRRMYAEQQAVRHTFEDRAQGISNLCLSVEVYNQTVQGADFSDGARARIERLSVEIRADVDRLAAGGHSDEAVLLASIRDLISRQQALYESSATQPPADRGRRRLLFTTDESRPLQALLLEWSRNADAWGAQRIRQDDDAVLLQFGRLQGTVSQAFVIALASALALVVGSMIYILRLERQTQLRYVELARSRHELQRLSSRLLDVQESERRSISRELHDEIGQSLGALLMDLSRLSAALPPDRTDVKEQVDRMKSVAERSVQAVRNIALLLRPSMLDDLGLGPALEWQGREVSRRSDIEVEVHAESASGDLPSEYATCIYRLVQEALNNAVRHSAARSAKVELEQSERRIRVRISDDGRGFDPKRTRGLGILGMEERVKRLGGEFTVDSAPGRGTAIAAELPLPQGEAAT
jgi:signal transduction histidine kinase